MDLNTEIWNEFKTTDSGVKILVTGEADGLKSAFFKNHTRRANAPTIFNEYLAYKLSLLLGYSIPKVQFLRFGQEIGIISFNIPESVPFQGFPKDNLLNILEDKNVFAKIAAFDMWIKSTDRHDRNVIVQHIGLDKYRIFMIDHEHSLYGAGQNQPIILDFTNIIKIDGFKSYVLSEEILLEEASKIQSLNDADIISLIDDIKNNSDGLFTEDCANIIRDLLIQRKPILQEKLKEWYNS